MTVYDVVCWSEEYSSTPASFRHGLPTDESNIRPAGPMHLGPYPMTDATLCGLPTADMWTFAFVFWPGAEQCEKCRGMQSGLAYSERVTRYRELTPKDEALIREMLNRSITNPAANTLVIASSAAQANETMKLVARDLRWVDSDGDSRPIDQAPAWLQAKLADLVDEEPPAAQCSECGRKTWDDDWYIDKSCDEIQPDHTRCTGEMRVPGE